MLLDPGDERTVAVSARATRAVDQEVAYSAALDQCCKLARGQNGIFTREAA